MNNTQNQASYPIGSVCKFYSARNRERYRYIVFYHANCADGFGAAWAAHRHTKKYEYRTEDTEVHYVPCNYHTSMETLEKYADLIKGSYVSVFDFSFSSEGFEFLYECQPKSLTIIDHHVGAKDIILSLKGRPNTYVNYSEEHSGCVLTWQYFDGKDSKCPDILLYIEDRDLWKFSLENTREVCAAIYSYPQDFDVWDELQSKPLEELVNEGRAICRSRDKDLKQHMNVKNLTFSSLEGHKIVAVNAPYYVASELCNALLEEYPDVDIAASYTYLGDETIQISLRSRKDEVDVSEIAKGYGGGGHASAAGCTVEFLPWREEAREKALLDLRPVRSFEDVKRTCERQNALLT